MEGENNSFILVGRLHHQFVRLKFNSQTRDLGVSKVYDDWWMQPRAIMTCMQLMLSICDLPVFQIRSVEETVFKFIFYSNDAIFI